LQEIDILFDELGVLVRKYEADVKNMPKEELKASVKSIEVRAKHSYRVNTMRLHGNQTGHRVQN
jgi:hypothetical protein